MADDNNKIIVSRIQHRRGLKQDLPQPLRPGEIGFATDSRQVYIGGDSSHPNSSQFRAVSIFENTQKAREITQSILNNQIIAFTVPGIKYIRGEFDGISIQKTWNPASPRSIIGATQSPQCAHVSSNTQVFDKRLTDELRVFVDSQPQLTEPEFIVSTVSGELPAIEVQPGDEMFDESGKPRGIVQARTIQSNQTTLVRFASPVGGPSIVGTQVTFRSPAIFNMFAGSLGSRVPFVSSNVTVTLNGVKLIPEANSAVKDRPGPTADYVLDAQQTKATVEQNDAHRLTLRTPPGPRDEVSVTYYGNAQVHSAFAGNNSQISSAVNFPSFYSDQSIPEFLQIDAQNVRTSTVTGLGYIALETKHITSFALSGTNIANPGNLSDMGNLLVARTDSEFTVNSASEPTTSNKIADPTTTSFDFNSGSSVEFSSGLQVFRANEVNNPTQTKDFYRYNYLIFSSSNPNDYLNTSKLKLRPVKSASLNNGTATVEVEIPDITDVVVARSGQTSPEGSNTVIQGSTVGILSNDLITVYFNGGNVVANVIPDSVNPSSFKVDQVITESNVTYVNHGTGTPADSFQLFLPGIGNKLDKSQVTDGNIYLFADGQTTGTQTTFTKRDPNTGFVDALPDIADLDFDTDPDQQKKLTVRPILGAYEGTITLTPVLSVFLGTAASVSEVAAVVNENRNIDIPEVGITPLGANSTESIELLPSLNVQPSNPSRVFVTQRPGYSSVDVGGVGFELIEDPDRPTLAQLNLESRKYNRDDTVRAKLEKWLNKALLNRRVNLFTEVLLPGEPYSTDSEKVAELGSYSLTVDSTLEELRFCDRTEAENFNVLVNNLYANNAFQQRKDILGGARGLLNIKNNIELQTNESAGIAEKISTFLSMETATLLPTDHQGAGNTVFSLDITQFNNFVIDYSIADQSGADSYQRTGTMYISARPDLPGSAIITDVFASYIASSGNNQLEPKFEAQLNGNNVEIKLAKQEDPTNPNNQDFAYDIDAELNMRYVVRRWSSFN